MEEKPYVLVEPKGSKHGLEEQLKEWHEKGYKYIGYIDNFLAFKKKAKKTKKE